MNNGFVEFWDVWDQHCKKKSNCNYIKLILIYTIYNTNIV